MHQYIRHNTESFKILLQTLVTTLIVVIDFPIIIRPSEIKTERERERERERDRERERERKEEREK